MKTDKQLAYEKRGQIYVLSKTGMSQNNIAKHANVSHSAISRKPPLKTDKRGNHFK
jgi:IS30 family transposase